jgi:hypothetical protein
MLKHRKLGCNKVDARQNLFRFFFSELSCQRRHSGATAKECPCGGVQGGYSAAD